MIRAVQRLSDIAVRATGWAVAAMAAAMIVSLILQVFSRYILAHTFVWTEELALFLFTWLVLLTASIGVARAGHVRLTLLLDALPDRPRALLERFIDLLILLFALAFAYSGQKYVNATLGQVSAAVNYPVVWLHAAAPVSGALMALHALARLLAGPPEESPRPVPAAPGPDA